MTWRLLAPWLVASQLHRLGFPDDSVELFLRHESRYDLRQGYAAFRAPWPEWTACNPMTAFASRCSPAVPRCNETVTLSEGVTHGLGNSAVSLRGHMREAYARGCYARYESSTPSEPGQFRMADYMHPLQGLVPAVVKGDSLLAAHKGDGGAVGCILFAALQPGPEVTAAVDAVLQDGVGRGLPLVGLHLRTGWADVERVLGGDAQAGPGAPLNACGRLYAHRFPNATADAFAAMGGAATLPPLRSILAALADAADGAFGRGRWRFFLATDSPGIKRFALRAMASRCAGVLSSTGLPLGHTAIRTGNDPRSDPARARGVAVGALADLVALSSADMVLNNQYSRYSMAARMRAVCPQRYLEIKGRIAGHVADLGTKIAPLVKAEADVSPGDGGESGGAEPVPAALEAWVRPGHPCLRMPRPVLACACFFKAAFE